MTSASHEMPAVPEREPDSPLSETLAAMPSYATHGLLYIVIAFLLIGLAYSSVSSIDVVVAAPAVVVPEGRAKPIQPSIPGVITLLHVQEGDAVAEGQVLATLESTEVSTYLGSLEVAEAEMAAVRKEIRDVLPLHAQQIEKQVQVLEVKASQLKKGLKALTRKIAAEQTSHELSCQTAALEKKKQEELVQRLQVETSSADGLCVLRRKEYDANARLREKSAVSEADFLIVQRALAEADGAARKIKSMGREAASEQEIMVKKVEAAKLLHERTLADLREQQEQMELDQAALETQIAHKKDEGRLHQLEAEKRRHMAEFRRQQARLMAGLSLRGVREQTLDAVSRGSRPTTNEMTLTSPAAGRVTQVMVRGKGESVGRGQTIMTLVPAGVTHLTEVRVPNRDIGQIEVGQRVHYKFDAFPFADHGIITGSVARVLPDAENGDRPDRKTGESFYRVIATLDQDYFWVKDNKVELLSGMSATAEIVTDRKTLLQLALKPFVELRRPENARR